ELKAYMHVGHSRSRLDRAAMPDHDDVVAFAEDVAAHLPHEVHAESAESRIALLSKTEDTWVPALRPGSEFWAADGPTHT
ncbi:MAG: 4-demethylwyosine synthase TYW1, partial [Halobacteriaceae archaeon]